MITINKINHSNKSDIHKSNQPFDIIGSLEIYFQNGNWEYSEVLSSDIKTKHYPDFDGADADDYISAPDKTAFFAYWGNECVGQILISKTWNKYVCIDDISVAKANRGHGIGTMLLKKAEAWAKVNDIKAFSVECQDNNVLASRFFSKNGFQIGGVNTKLYSMLGKPYESEKAVFWYKNI